MASPGISSHQAVASIQEACRHVQAEAGALKKQMTEWRDLEGRIRQNIAKAPSIVTLNVGGTMFQSFKDTFLRVQGSYFHALLGSGAWSPDSPGDAYFLDLDPDIFRHVFKFLRTGTLWMDGLPQHERSQLKAMMEYLKLDETNKAPPVFQWDPAMCAPELTLSNHFRTVERLRCNGDGSHKRAMTKLPLVGSLRLRVDCIRNCTGVGVGPKTSCDTSFLPPKNPRHCLWSFGCLYEDDASVKTGLPQLKAGDVVTLTRTPSSVEFTINDGPTYPIELKDATEELFPMVSMSRSGTKITMLDATEA